jgi:hypothetical protein
MKKAQRNWIRISQRISPRIFEGPAIKLWQFMKLAGKAKTYLRKINLLERRTCSFQNR